MQGPPNPYAPPQAPMQNAYAPQYQAPPPRIDGDLLTIAKVAAFPAICVKCGSTEALAGRVQKFAWFPQWTYFLLVAGLLPAAIVQLIMTKRATFNLPLCEPCSRRWTNARIAYVLGILGTVIGGILLMAIGAANHSVEAIIPLGGALLILGFPITAILTHYLLVRPRTLRATFIDDHFATLAGVAPKTLDAMRG